MHIWDGIQQCYVTSHDETNDEVELYLPPQMAHWFDKCPQELQADEHLFLTVNKQKSSAVINREFDNMTKEEVLQHHKEVAEAKLAELK
eukprot:12935298-Prorocentrum_lima.AAC.1